MMKKLLLILLCLPMIGFGQGYDLSPKYNKNCNKKADYIMTAEDFIKVIEKNNKKYDGKVFQFTIDMDKKGSSGTGFGQAKINFRFSDLDAELSFGFDIWSEEEDEYYDKLRDAKKKRGYKGSVLTIKGVYSDEDSELKKDNYIEGEYKFIHCCLATTDKNIKVKKNTNKKSSDKINSNTENFLYGKINDPDGYTNVRRGKTSKSDILFKVYKNKKFRIIDNTGSWWLIEYNHQQGYMYKGKIDIIK